MKEHFESYIDIVKQIEEARYDLSKVENDLLGIKAISYDDAPKGTGHFDNRIYLIAKKDDILKEIKALQDEKDILYRKHLEEIAKVNDDKCRSILRCYYLRGYGLQDIAEMLHISLSHVKKLKRKAIDDFKDANCLN